MRDTDTCSDGISILINMSQLVHSLDSNNLCNEVLLNNYPHCLDGLQSVPSATVRGLVCEVVVEVQCEDGGVWRGREGLPHQEEAEDV